jgi:hypothetical protein
VTDPLLNFLEVIGLGEHGTRIPECGKILRGAKVNGLVTFDERGTPRLTEAGVREYRRRKTEEKRRVYESAAQ